jgi:hypothetical protein
MPAMATLRKKISMEPRLIIAAAQIAVRPAAGPLTLNSDLLIRETTNPPIMPEIIPEDTGAPDASEIPRQRGNATKNTVILALKSCLRNERKKNLIFRLEESLMMFKFSKISGFSFKKMRLDFFICDIENQEPPENLTLK